MPAREAQVSVCIPTYNRAALLRESIESVLAQSLDDFELIVLDNASEDATESVVRQFSDGRIRYFRNSRNLGHRQNINLCFSLARGKYIALLPDDDLMMAENLAVKVEVLNSNPEVGFVHSKYHVIDGEGRVTLCNTNWGHGPDRMSDELENLADVLLTMYNTFNLPTVLFRRACYERLGGFTDRLKFAIDYEYWMRLAVYFQVAFLARPLIKWRVYSGSMTNVCLGEDEVFKLKEIFAAKRLIIRNHLKHVPNGAALKKLIWRQMGDKTVDYAEEMLGEAGPNPRVRAFVWEMCRAFPELLLHKPVWKMFLKSVLSRSSIDRLKRISPI